MSTKKEATARTRRDFFKLAGLGAGALVAAGTTSTVAKAAVGGGSERRGTGYRETEHVKKAYELARF